MMIFLLRAIDMTSIGVVTHDPHPRICENTLVLDLHGRYINIFLVSSFVCVIESRFQYDLRSCLTFP